MKRERIELIVRVDIFYKDKAFRKLAIQDAKDNVMATSSTFAEPKSAVLSRRKKEAQ